MKTLKTKRWKNYERLKEQAQLRLIRKAMKVKPAMPIGWNIVKQKLQEA